MDDQCLHLLRKRLTASLDACSAAMLGGACADYPAYRELCGRAHGLNEALREIEDILRQREED